MAGTISLVTRPDSLVSSSMTPNAVAIRSGRVDHDGDHRHVQAELEDPVAVRGMVAVEAPDPAHGRWRR